MLVSAGVEINLKNKNSKQYGDTALIKASQYGHKEIVEMLLRKVPGAVDVDIIIQS